MPIRKAKQTKKKSARKKAAKKPASRKRTTKKATAPRPYVEPKTAAEWGIVCSTVVDGEKCGKPVIWFDYAIGERNHMAGFVCDEHRVSNRVERLAVKKQSAATVL